MGPYPHRYKKVKIVADADMDGLHINVLVTLIFIKYYPELVKEERLSIVLPPLYGAKKGKEFIPIYDVREVEKYASKNYEVQRFKGLGEMTDKQMRLMLDQNVEYIVKYPKNKKKVEDLLKIITDTSEKRKYLDKLEFNFESFITDVFSDKDEENIDKE